MFDLARVAQRYGTGDVRITTSQNVIVPNVPESALPEMTSEPLLRELRHDPSDMMRGVVSCTGIDYCHMALIETKELALKTARELDARLGSGEEAADHALVRLSRQDAATIRERTSACSARTSRLATRSWMRSTYSSAASRGRTRRPARRFWRTCPCSDLPRVLEQVIPYVTNKRAARSMKKDVTVSVPAKA